MAVPVKFGRLSSDDGTRLLERLLADSGFRARFRDAPAAAAREAGFDDFAREMELDEPAPLETLEVRESHSSFGGMMFAAAAEGLDLVDLAEHVGAEEAATGARPASDAAEPVSASQLANDQPDAEAAGDSPPDVEEPDEEEPDEEESDEDEPDEEEPEEDEPDEDEDDDEPDEDEPDDEESDDGQESDGEEPNDLGETDDEESDDGDEPDGEESDHSGDAETDGAPARLVPAPRGDWQPDPQQYGMAGGGGPPSPFDAALLKNDNITLDANGRQDFAKGRMDPRLSAMLLRLAERHELTISSTASDHPHSTAGGSPSNHWFGRAFDIATVDGEIVRPGSAGARRLAEGLRGLDASIRPTEIGSPWAIDGPEYFTDADHQDHIHVGFDDIVDRRWLPPQDTRVMPAVRRDRGRSL